MIMDVKSINCPNLPPTKDTITTPPNPPFPPLELLIFLPRTGKMVNPHYPPPVETPPLILISKPPPSDHSLSLWVELALQGKSLTLQANIKGQPVTLIIQKSAYLADVVKEGLNNAIDGLGHLIWTQTLLQIQLMGIQEPLTISETNNLMAQVFQTKPFFPVYQPPMEVANLQFTLCSQQEEMTREGQAEVGGLGEGEKLVTEILKRATRSSNSS